MKKVILRAFDKPSPFEGKNWAENTLSLILGVTVHQWDIVGPSVLFHSTGDPLPQAFQLPIGQPQVTIPTKNELSSRGGWVV